MDAFSQDFTDVDANEAMEDTGGFVNKEGKYHMEVSEVDFKLDPTKTCQKDGVDVTEDATPHVVLKMKVLHSVDGQSGEGAGYWHRIFLQSKGGGALSDGAKKGLVKQLVRLGLLKTTDSGGVVVASTGQPGSAQQSDYESLAGRQYIVQIDKEEAKGNFKESYRCNWGNLWCISDETVKDVPRNPEMQQVAMAAMAGSTPAATTAATSNIPAGGF